LKVSLVIAVYNEANHLEKFLKEIDSFILPFDKELIIVDDCSTDGSREILHKFSYTSEVQILLQKTNQGKGVAVRRGILAATGDVIGIQDADFEYNMSDIPKLITPFIDDTADVVYGSRFKKSGAQVHRTFHYLINRILTVLSNTFSGLYLTDMETCYKFFKREIIQNIELESKRFGFEPEVTAKIARLKCRIMEFPISYFPRNYIEGKKISWKDGLAAVWHIINFNLLKNKKKFYKSSMSSKFIPTSMLWL